MRRVPVLLIPLLLVPLSLPLAQSYHACGIPAQPWHTYAPATAGTTIDGAAAFQGPVIGQVSHVPEVHVALGLVSDLNTFDCDGNGLPDDFDGDYENGFSSAFFGVYTWDNVWQNEMCGLGLHLHQGSMIQLTDFLIGAVAFWAGYEGEDDDEAAFEDPCVTDGVIGDDWGDCLERFVGWAPVDPCADEFADPLDHHKPKHKRNKDGGTWTLLECYAYPEYPSVECHSGGTAAIM